MEWKRERWKERGAGPSRERDVDKIKLQNVTIVSERAGQRGREREVCRGRI